MPTSDRYVPTDGFGTRGAAWGFGGLIIGYLIARSLGGPAAFSWGGFPAAVPAVAPAAAVPAVAPVGYGSCAPYAGCGFPPLQYEQFLVNREYEKRLAHVEAVNAAQSVATRKDAEISAMRDALNMEIVDGKVYRATCHKPDGRVYLSPSHLASSFLPSNEVLESHKVFPDRCREPRRNFRSDCDDCGNWY